MSERVQTAIVTAAVGVVLILIARWALRIAVARYERRLVSRRTPDELASLHTRLSVLVRVVVVFLAVIVVWQVLAIFPATGKLANTVIASGAVLALFVGLAFSTPLGNLGAGILLAFSQPVRIGDRVTVDEVTGRAEQISLIYTVLITDDDRRVFVPNSQMVSSVVENRSVVDPRRLVVVEVPVALGTPLERARQVVTDSVRGSKSIGRPRSLRARRLDYGEGRVVDDDRLRTADGRGGRPRQRAEAGRGRGAGGRQAPARLTGLFDDEQRVGRRVVVREQGHPFERNRQLVAVGDRLAQIGRRR